MPELVMPDIRNFDSFQESWAEWGSDDQEGTALAPERHDTHTPEGFASWVAELVDCEHTPPVPGFVTCTFRWVIVDGQYVGSVSLRHELNDFLLEEGGHIGYGIRPSMRRRGLASFALAGILDHARSRGMDKVLLVCLDDNVASIATIERAGGVLEDIRTGHDGDRNRRYWITL